MLAVNQENEKLMEEYEKLASEVRNGYNQTLQHSPVFRVVIELKIHTNQYNGEVKEKPIEDSRGKIKVFATEDTELAELIIFNLNSSGQTNVITWNFALKMTTQPEQSRRIELEERQMT